MEKWAALLGAVNVGGRNLVKMAELKAALLEAGFAGVKTYLQSGNVVLQSDLPRAEVAGLVADVVLARFGFRPPVMVVSAGELHQALTRHRFVQAEEQSGALQIHFAAKGLPPETRAFLEAVAAPGEAAQVEGRLLWLWLPGGVARSKLARKVSALPVEMTARNLRTVQALAALMEG